MARTKEGLNVPPWEVLLRQIILPDLDKGRKNFDRPHTEGVVHWMKELTATSLEANGKVLITTAYGHDWGYRGLFGPGKSSDPEEIRKKKDAHMEIGRNMIGKLLRSNDFKDLYTEEEITRVQHLVFVHDRVEELSEDDEIMIMEADTLGMLDTDFAKPTFSPEDNARFIEKEIRDRRRPAFRHQTAIDVFDALLQKRIDFYDAN